MKNVSLKRAVILGLILSADVFNLAYAEDVHLVQKNLHFRNGNGLDGYSKAIEGNLTIKLTATGSGSNKNYNEDNFKANEGQTASSPEFGKAVLLQNKSSLTVTGDIDISVIPADWKGNKFEMMRVGIELAHDSTLEAKGNTKIEVINYKNAYSESNLADDEDVGLKPQRGLTVSDRGNANLAGNLDITMENGNCSMGIYATGSKASLTVGGDTTITVENGASYTYGIANQFTGAQYGFDSTAEDADLNFKGNLNITTEGGNNSAGINLKDKSRNTDGRDTIVVEGKTIITSRNAKIYEKRDKDTEFPDSVSNYGIFMNNIASAAFNDAEITTDSTNSVTNDKFSVESIGTYLYNSNNTFKGNVKYTTTANDGHVAISALARNGSNLTYEKGFIADGKVALNAVSGSAIAVNSTESNEEVSINGNIVVGKTQAANITDSDTLIDENDVQNKIDVNFLSQGSVFTGINEFGNSGSEINLNFANGAKWNMTGSSPVTDLELADGAVVDMTYSNTDAGSGFRKLVAKTISGEGGIINMNIDASANTDNSDRVYVDSTHSGTHYITLHNVGSNEDGADGTVLVSVKDEQGEFLAKPDEGKLYWNKYTLDKVDSDYYDGENSYDWILSDIEKTDDPTTSVDTILGANALNYHTWLLESDKLMKRMGDLRHNGEDEKGVWFRVRGSKISRDDNAAFENKYTTYELGYDVLDKETEDYKRYNGAAISYSDGSSSYEHGSGENSSKAISFYSTTMRNKGHYLDFVFKVVDMDNDFSVFDTNGNNITGAMDNKGVSLNVEYGRKKDLGNKWYIEPQGQLTLGYLGGDNYRLNNGVAVGQGGISSLVGRIGFNIGRDVDEKTNLYLKANLLHEFLGDYSLDMTDTATGDTLHKDGSFGDTWGEIGIGAAIRTGKNNHIYFDVEKTFGGDFEKDWGWNAGVRWTF